MTTRKYCACDDRLNAEAARRFVYWVARRAWCFESRRRAMSMRSRYYAFVDRAEYKHEDHAEEPYTFECCPWCGNDLPGIPDLLGASQADGFPGDPLL